MSTNNDITKPIQYQPETVRLTAACARKIWSLMQAEENLQLKLRAYVTGGGCSGLQYGFAFEEAKKADDIVIERPIQGEEEEDEEGGEGSVQLLIDPISYQYLLGAEVDYQTDIKGEQFVIKNPNAKTTCGCGTSFSL